MPIHALNPSQARFAEEIMRQTTDLPQKTELQALREDIAELKEILISKPSVILTGQQVIDEYRIITQPNNYHETAK